MCTSTIWDGCIVLKLACCTMSCQRVINRQLGHPQPLSVPATWSDDQPYLARLFNLRRWNEGVLPALQWLRGRRGCNVSQHRLGNQPNAGSTKTAFMALYPQVTHPTTFHLVLRNLGR